MAAIREKGFIAYCPASLVARGQRRLGGVPPDAAFPDPAWTEFLATLADQAAIAIDNATLLGDLRRPNADLTIAYDATLEGWSRALELRDKETEGTAGA